MLKRFALLLLVATTSVVAAEPGLKGADGWIREAPPAAPVRAGYLRLHNGSATELVITGARSDAFGAIEIHQMVSDDGGTMRMRPLPELVVAAGATVALEPGGAHLMLFRPLRALARGERVPVRLVLAGGDELAVELEQR